MTGTEPWDSSSPSLQFKQSCSCIFSGVGNAVAEVALAAAAALAAAPFRPRLCGKASSEPYNSASVDKGSTTPFIE